MEFETNTELERCRQELLEMLSAADHHTRLLAWVHSRSSSGWTKQNIYSVLLLLCGELAQGEDETLYNRLTDFMDGFTSWAKAGRILPGEPDIA